jgi:hypothetical protein
VISISKSFSRYLFASDTNPQNETETGKRKKKEKEKKRN